MSVNQRPYQKKFYSSSDKVRDKHSRKRKGEKIRYLLTNFGGIDLSNAITLDVGCSSGFITNHLSTLFHKTIGVEYDREALSKAERDNSNSPEYIQGDAMALPITSSSIDVVICAQTYEHVPDDTKMFEEIYRVLKPGGIVFFSGPNWLFPVEPHYYLPLLHWLPQKVANRYLKIFKHEDHYYEKSRTLWSLRRQLKKFFINDYTFYTLFPQRRSTILSKPHQLVINWLSKIMLPFVPNFNFILRKPLIVEREVNGE